MSPEKPQPWYQVIKDAVESTGRDTLKSWVPVNEGAVVSATLREDCAGVTVYLLGDPKLSSNPKNHHWFYSDPQAIESAIGPVKSFHSCETLKGLEMNTIGDKFWKEWEEMGYAFLDSLRSPRE